MTESFDELLGQAPPPAQPFEFDLMRGAIARRLFGRAPGNPRIGRFEVVRILGSGGMGVVYLARDPDLGRDVALKLIRPRAGRMDPDAVARILREAKALGRLNHPNVVSVLDVGVTEGLPFVALEYVEGKTLERWCEESQWGTERRVQRVLDFAIQSAHGLLAAHRAGLIHRDVKPSNMIIGNDGRLRMVDFGLARDGTTQSSEPDLGPITPHGRLDSITHPGGIVGTPRYMAPEQFDGQVSAESDQFGWGVSFYEAFFGRLPFDGVHLASRLRAIEHGRIAPPREGHRVPAWIRAVLLRTLQADPAARFPSMQTVIERLEHGPRIERRRVQRLVWVSAIGVGVLAIRAGQREADEPCGGLQGDDAFVWTPDAAQRVRAKFIESAPDSGEEVWSRVDASLRTYAAQWEEARLEVCEAERSSLVTPQQAGAQLRCLSERRRIVETLVELWQASERVTDPAVAVGRLAEIAPCRDPESAATSWPSSPAFDSIVEQLARARAASLVGDYPLARALSEDAVRRSTEFHDEVALSGSSLQLGRVLVELGEIEAAMTHLQDAYYTALRAGRMNIAAQAATALVGVYGKLLRFRDAELWYAHGTSALRQVHNPMVWETVMLSEQWAVALRNAGRFDESIAELERILEILRADPGPNQDYIANVTMTLANALRLQGDFQRAEAAYREVVTIRTPLNGARHPRVGVAWSGLGVSLVELGRIKDGQAALEQAVDILRDTKGAQRLWYASALQHLAMSYDRSGDHDESLAKLDDALAIYEGYPDADPMNRDILMDHRATVLAQLGRFDEARVAMERSLTARESLFGPDHLATAESLANLAKLAQQMGELDKAANYFARARPIFERTVGPDSERMGILATDLGKLAWLQKDYEAARDHYRRGAEILGRLPHGHPNIPLAYRGLAKLHLREGEPRRAAEELTKALDWATDSELVSAVDRGTLALELAQAWWAAGDEERAAEQVRFVRTVASPSDPEGAELRENLRAWLETRSRAD